MKRSLRVRFFSFLVVFFFFLPSLSPAQPCEKKSLWASVLRFCLLQGAINMQGPLAG